MQNLFVFEDVVAASVDGRLASMLRSGQSVCIARGNAEEDNAGSSMA